MIIVQMLHVVERASHAEFRYGVFCALQAPGVRKESAPYDNANIALEGAEVFSVKAVDCERPRWGSAELWVEHGGCGGVLRRRT